MNGLTREQNTAISMILTNPSTGWKVTMRKILVIVFGQQILARSCCVGRRHATFQPLDASKLDMVRGMSVYGNMHNLCICQIFL